LDEVFVHRVAGLSQRSVQRIQLARRRRRVRRHGGSRLPHVVHGGDALRVNLLHLLRDLIESPVHILQLRVNLLEVRRIHVDGRRSVQADSHYPSPLMASDIISRWRKALAFFQGQSP
jgi:hypothetical protein